MLAILLRLALKLAACSKSSISKLNRFKLQNCIDAIHNGVSRVEFLDGRIPHCLLLEIFTNKGIGTAILNSREERYYHEEA